MDSEKHSLVLLFLIPTLSLSYPVSIIPEVSSIYFLLAFLVLSIPTVYIVYSTFFHPLHHIPGPPSARLCNLYQLWHVYNGTFHKEVWRLHQQYGPVIRIAPNRLIFNTASAVHSIYPSHKGMTKANGYDTKPFDRSQASLFNTISHSHATFKKKLLAPLNGRKASMLHDHAVQAQTQALVNSISNSPIIDMSVAAFQYSLDAISHSILGLPFGLLHAQHTWLPHSVLSGNRHMYIHLTSPFLFRMLSLIIDTSIFTYPLYHTEGASFTHLVRTTLSTSSSSIAHLLLDTNAELASYAELEGEIFTLLRAGGDTVAAAVAGFFFYITRCSSRATYTRLAHEIRTTFPSVDAIRPGTALDNCVFLRRCIDEALRMAPPAPGVFWRQATTACTIDGVSIPAGTELGVGVYALHHNEELFPDAFSYRPSRFAARGARAGFVPFLRGFRSCPAQKMAYSMMMVPIARLLWEFDVVAVGRRGAGEAGVLTGPDAEAVYQQRDMFSAKVDGPLVRFSRRRGGDPESVCSLD